MANLECFDMLSDIWALLKLVKYRSIFSYVDSIFDFETQKPIKRWVLLLPGAGCSWAKKEHGGCLMCGFKFKVKEATRGRLFSAKELMRVLKVGYFFLPCKSPRDLTIYNGGSFLNDEEIGSEAQMEICKWVGKHPTINNVFIESRPEFVTEEKIRSLKGCLGKKQLKVGLGLECVTDEIRENCVNKGFSRKSFEKAVTVLKNNRVQVLTYVFIKPLFLTERGAIEEAVRTAFYAFEAGSNEVAFEGALVQTGTKMAEYYNKGEFRPPWLWSIIEIIKATHGAGHVRVGEFKDEPAPISIPHNCSKCTPAILELFREFKKNENISIFDQIDCECKAQWKRNLDKV